MFYNGGCFSNLDKSSLIARYKDTTPAAYIILCCGIGIVYEYYQFASNDKFWWLLLLHIVTLPLCFFIALVFADFRH